MLIGLMGHKRSGKDTFASVLVGYRDYHRLAFADAMKDALLDSDLYLPGDISLSAYVTAHGWDKAKENIRVRRLIQNFGTAIREHIGEDTWLAPVRRETERLLLNNQNVIITDVRFENEAQLVKDLGGVLITIERPGLVTGDTHISETGIPFHMADYAFTNEGPLWEVLLDAYSFEKALSAAHEQPTIF